MRMEFRDVRLDYLLEQRDDLEARIRRINVDASPKAGSLAAAQAQLADVNAEIANHRPRDN